MPQVISARIFDARGFPRGATKSPPKGRLFLPDRKTYGICMGFGNSDLDSDLELDSDSDLVLDLELDSGLAMVSVSVSAMVSGLAMVSELAAVANATSRKHAPHSWGTAQCEPSSGRSLPRQGACSLQTRQEPERPTRLSSWCVSSQVSMVEADLDQRGFTMGPDQALCCELCHTHQCSDFRRSRAFREEQQRARQKGGLFLPDCDASQSYPGRGTPPPPEGGFVGGGCVDPGGGKPGIGLPGCEQTPLPARPAPPLPALPASAGSMLIASTPRARAAINPLVARFGFI